MPAMPDAAETTGQTMGQTTGLFARFAEMLGLSGGGTPTAPTGTPPSKKVSGKPVEPWNAPRQSFNQMLAEAGVKTEMSPVALRHRMARRPPSFTDLLPWTAYAPDEQVFVLNDGASLGILFELDAVPTEAQPLDYLMGRAMRVQEALQALPEADGSSWIVQFFLNDDRDIAGLNEAFRDYIAQVHEKEPERQKAVLDSPMTRAFLDEIARHLTQVSKPEGLFMDTQVTGQIWRGQTRRVRCCIYRRFPAQIAAGEVSAMAQLDAVATTLKSTFAEAGIGARRCNGKDLYDWLLPFFNRAPGWVPKDTAIARFIPYPGDRAGQGRPAGTLGPNDRGEAPIFGWSLAELLNYSEPYSDPKAGVFVFDGVPVRALVLQNIRRQPQIGHFSAELSGDDGKNFARFDRLPPGAMLSISVTLKPQHVLQRRVERIRHASRASNAEARETYAECEAVLTRMAHGDKVFPMNVTLYLAAGSLEALDGAISETNALLSPSGLRFIDPKQDLAPLDAFMQSLPFNFDPHFDEKKLKRSRLTFVSQIANLLPVYGRSRGTGHPGMWFWNRGGEPLWLDPLNKRDRRKNAHMLMLGPTGAGKSATLNYLAMMAMAVHRPRLVIVDAGKSFGLLVEWFRTMGLSVHNVELSSDAEVSLPPFVNACKLLDDPDVMESFQAVESLSQDEAGMEAALEQTPILTEIDAAEQQEEARQAQGAASDQTEEGEEEDQAETEKRDLLGEMLIAALMMITGGEKKEEDKMSRSDRYLVTRAIIGAAWQARAAGKAHPLVHDVAIALMQMQKDPALSSTRQARAEDMGQAMMAFTQGLRGKLFNRPGQDWPDVDVTLVEMGTLVNDGYEDARALAYTSLIDSAQARGERFQYEDRPLVFLTDEAHLVTTSDLLGPKIAKATKMWRKLNVWLWLATQNLKDFPDSMDRVLSMCEYWVLLTMDKSEIEQVARFRSLTDEQRAMMESAKKETPKYTEGVIIDASGQYLFRNVPPALPIALAMTEGHEKAARRRIMQQRNCTEMEAAQYMAEQLAANRG